MTEVAMLKLKGDDSAMDLSVKCGRINLHRPPPRDQVEAEEETLAAFLHGPGGRRGVEGGLRADMQSVPVGRDWLQHHHQTLIYRSAHFDGPMIQNAPEGVPRRNGYGAYPGEIGSRHHDDNDEAMTSTYAMQKQRILTSLPPFNYYVPEMHCSNDDDDDDEFMTSSTSMTSSHLTQTSSAPDDDVARRVYPCFPFASNNNINNNNIYEGGRGGVSPGAPAVSTVAAGERAPSPPDGPSGVVVAPSSPIFFNPRKRFLAEIRKAACPPQTSPTSSSSSSSSEPNSTSGQQQQQQQQQQHHHLAPPSQSPADVSTPSSTEERRHQGSRGGGNTTFFSTEKDEAYWERRRKNNEAAKRSRDIRRQKEEQVAARAASLSAENVQLRAQIEVLKTQLALIHSMVISGAHRQA